MSNSSGETVRDRRASGPDASPGACGRGGNQQDIRVGSFPGLTAAEMSRHGPDRDDTTDPKRSPPDSGESDTSTEPTTGKGQHERGRIGPDSGRIRR